MKRISTITSSALVFLTSLLLAALGLAAERSSADVLEALPAGFPVPEGALLLKKEGPTVRVGVEGANLEELADFFHEKLREQDYRIIRRTTDQDEETLFPGEDDGINLMITPRGGKLLVDTQGLYIRRVGDQVWFELTTELMELR